MDNANLSCQTQSSSQSIAEATSMSNQLTFMFSYAPQIFKAIGLTGNSIDLLATGVVGVINFFSTIPAIMFLDR
jgi:Sugar (and other) transporter